MEYEDLVATIHYLYSKLASIIPKHHLVTSVSLDDSNFDMNHLGAMQQYYMDLRKTLNEYRISYLSLDDRLDLTEYAEEILRQNE